MLFWDLIRFCFVGTSLRCFQMNFFIVNKTTHCIEYIVANDIEYLLHIIDCRIWCYVAVKHGIQVERKRWFFFQPGILSLLASHSSWGFLQHSGTIWHLLRRLHIGSSSHDLLFSISNTAAKTCTLLRGCGVPCWWPMTWPTWAASAYSVLCLQVVN